MKFAAVAIGSTMALNLCVLIPRAVYMFIAAQLIDADAPPWFIALSWIYLVLGIATIAILGWQTKSKSRYAAAWVCVVGHVIVIGNSFYELFQAYLHLWAVYEPIWIGVIMFTSLMSIATLFIRWDKRRLG